MKGKGVAKPGYNTTCWLSKALIEFYTSKKKCSLFSKKAKPELIVKAIIQDRLDLLVHMPGFNHGGQAMYWQKQPADNSGENGQVQLCGTGKETELNSAP